MRTDDEALHEHPAPGRGRTVLALIAWALVASVTVGSLVYTSFARFVG